MVHKTTRFVNVYRNKNVLVCFAFVLLNEVGNNADLKCDGVNDRLKYYSFFSLNFLDVLCRLDSEILFSSRIKRV